MTGYIMYGNMYCRYIKNILYLFGGKAAKQICSISAAGLKIELCCMNQ